MKKVLKNRIINIEWTALFDNKFLFDYLDTDYKSNNVEVFFIEDLLSKKKNEELYNNLDWRWAMWSEVYSPKDELEIFIELFDYAISNNKKIHIVWITLKEELDILEDYYKKEWYLREDVNCFIVDFKKVLVSVSVNIENLIWRWSDYKSNWKKIFFVPPIRESWQNKAMFKWINKGSIAGINIKNSDDLSKIFLKESIVLEKIMPLTLAKVLKYNIEDIWFSWEDKYLEIDY